MWFEMLKEELPSLYLYTVKHVVAGPMSLSYGAPFILLPAALMIPPTTLSQNQLICFFLLPIYACIIHAWKTMGGIDVISVGLVLWSTFLIAFHDPRSDFVRLRFNHLAPSVELGKASSCETSLSSRGSSVISDTIEGRQRSEAGRVPAPCPIHYESYPVDMLPRLYWVVSLIASDRLGRWKIGIKRHDARQVPILRTRRQYNLDVLPQIALAFFFLCLTTLVAKHDPYYRAATTISIASAYPPISPHLPTTIRFIQTHIPPYITRPLNTLIYAFSLLGFAFNLSSYIAASLNHLFNIPPDDWSPHTLPPTFGSFTSVLATGVRGLWGTWWHQHTRYMVSAPGTAFAKLLGLKRGSVAYYALPLFSAFLFSGISHLGMVPPAPALAKGGFTAWSLRWRIGAFFWVQPIGILLEMAIAKALQLALLKLHGGASGQRGVGGEFGRVAGRSLRLVWVLTWLCLSVTLINIPFSALGYWDLSTPRFLPGWARFVLAGGFFP